MKLWARILTVASPVLVAVGVVLMLRPGRADLNWGGWDFLRQGALAAAVSVCASATAWAARRRHQWSLAVSAGTLAPIVVFGVLRYRSVPEAGMVVVVAAWFGAAVPTLLVVLTASVARGRRIPKRLRVGMMAMGASAVAVALVDHGRGLGSYLSGPPNGTVAGAARVALAIHLAITAMVLVVAGRHLLAVAGARRDPVVWSALAWAPMVLAERIVHLGGPGRYGDGIVGRYSGGALALGVHLPLLAMMVVAGVAAWVTAVRPRLARLPTGMIVVPDRDPFELIRADLAAWLGDPTLTVTVADRAAAGREHPLGARRARTSVSVGGRSVAVLEHDIALAGAHHELRTTAMMAGLAEDANRLLAEEIASLRHAQELAIRLVGADAQVRERLAAELQEGPIARLWNCADALAFGASVEEVSEQLRTVTAEVRRLSHGLYPPELLGETLRSLLPGHVGAPDVMLPSSVQVTAYLIAQHDPHAAFAVQGSRLVITVPSSPLPDRLVDRVNALGGTVSAGTAELALAPLAPSEPRPDADARMPT